MSPENKPQSTLEFQEPNQPEEVQATAEVEVNLERLKNPEYWQRRFQTEWEQKAGQEKNWSGLRMMREITPQEDCEVFGVDLKGNVMFSTRQKYQDIPDRSSFWIRQYFLLEINTGKLKELKFFDETNALRMNYEDDFQNSFAKAAKLPDNTYILIGTGGDGIRISDSRREIKQWIIGFPEYDIALQNPRNKMSISSTMGGRIVIAPVENKAQIWSSPFYAGYWSEINRDQEITTDSIGPTLNQALDDITNMPLERIWDLQIDSAIKTFSQRLPQKKQNREEWQNCTEVAGAFRLGFDSWRKIMKGLPKSVGKSEIDTSTLPKPAEEPDLV